jgi:hypothetical protein
MNTFKRNALFAAVVAGLGTAAGTAEAVYLNPNRTGQALVYPYYTVRSSNGTDWNTYISVVNTTTRAKAVKVRVLEGKTSNEVLDFNLFLSANDVWTAAIVPSSSGGTKLVTSDVSCTRPAIDPTGVEFRNFQYSRAGTIDAAIDSSLDRTREGYIEMLEMATLTGATATSITHVNGVTDCSDVQDPTFTTVPVADLLPPSGGLMGTGTLINVASGLNGDYKADALEAWSNTAQYSDSGSTAPRLDAATPAISVVTRAGDLDATGSSTLITAYRTEFADTVGGPTAGAKAVASVFMHSAVMNEYVLDNATASLTDWVITQPLKNLFVTDTTAFPPYTNKLTTSGACETIGFTFFDREERSAAAGGVDFSPTPPGGQPNSLCWESTILSIRNDDAHTTAAGTVSNVLGSTDLTNVNVRAGFQNGWAALTFTGAGASATGLASSGLAGSTHTAMGMDLPPGTVVTTASEVTFFGLPVTGFAMRTFTNGTLTCSSGSCQGNYGGLFQHSYRTTITP